ncbi:MAG: response regulator [bacterium]
MPEKTILVIEDEEDVVDFLKMALEDAEYRVITAADGEEALECIKREQPDLITLDLIMPNKTGIGLYSQLRRSPEYKDIPIIVVTGVDRDSKGVISFREFLQKRAVAKPEAYLVKPINAEELLKTVQEVLSS